MSTEITRMYANAATAAKAASELREEGYGDVFVVGPPAADTPLSAIAAQIAQGRVLLADAKIYAKGVAAGHALVTDVSLKRKLRNFVGMAKDKQPLFEIYVKEKAIPNHQHKRAYAGIGREELLAGDDKKRKGGRCGGRCAAVDVPQLL